MTDVEKIANVFKSKFAGKSIEIGSYGWNNVPIDVINAVICLRRNFDSFVVPRLNALEKKYSNLTTLIELKKLIFSYPTALDFMIEEIDYNYEEKGQAILSLIDFLLSVEKQYSESTEKERLSRWAKEASPKDYKKLSIKGFGLAGFQQLRMLFGAQTVKPDEHIKDFIAEVIGHKVSDLQMIELFEIAAKSLSLPVRDIDALIWRERARKYQKKCL